MEKHSHPTQVWVDVGGTFTDCFVTQGREVVSRSDLLRGKTLSSGRVPVTVREPSNATQPNHVDVFVPELSGECDGFWNGATLVHLDANGELCASAEVLSSVSGRLTLKEKFSELTAGGSFEIVTGLEAPVLIVRRLLDLPLKTNLPQLQVRLGTTRGTNALLTATGAKTAFAVTKPFGDLLRIGDQTRSDLFSLSIPARRQLASCVIEVPERVAAEGHILSPLDEASVASDLQQARAQGCTSLAICLMHSFRNNAHELRLRELADEAGFDQISVSSQVANVIEFLARAETTMLDAYLSPVIKKYFEKLVEQFGGQENIQLDVMTSAGGLVPWQAYTGKDCILSGPAGGVRALEALAESEQIGPLIGFDMGGTSTDVCRVEDEAELEFESTKAGLKILTPTLPVETVAAGGGSVCWFDGVSLRVGPQSAGASPGPACYGRGGPLTVTDLNVYLGIVPVEQFPFPVDRDALEVALTEVFEQCRSLGFESKDALALGFRRLANEQMAEAVRTVTISRGCDPRDHGLVGFGGAAGQHICDVAELLGIETIIDVPEAGLLSALGMGLARQQRNEVIPVYQKLEDLELDELLVDAAEVAVELRKELSESEPNARTQNSVRLEVRYVNTDVALTVPAGSRREVTEAFRLAHKKRFGYVRDTQPLEVVSIRVNCSEDQKIQLPSNNFLQTPDAEVVSGQQVIREQLKPGQVVQGPCVICNQGSTLMVAKQWRAWVGDASTLLLKRELANQQNDTGEEADAKFDPVFRDCFAGRLVAIATQMGEVLQQTAISVNIKRRRDYSCAIFTADGQLLANAPHVPVHLGAMGETVRSILRMHADMKRGDCFLTNDPFLGGSHLPDLTLVTPVFDESDRLRFVVANRAHHADVGGKAPGSMSIEATCLADEGVVIAPVRLEQTSGRLAAQLDELLANAKFPPRKPSENIADIQAQVAANLRGVELISDYAGVEGWSRLSGVAAYLLEASEQRVRQFIRQLRLEEASVADQLDDGTAINVRLKKIGVDCLKISFAGTGDVHPTSFNANPSITKAAIFYVLRCLIRDDLPLNEGLLGSLELEIPEGLLDPCPLLHGRGSSPDAPAVAAGNVETSQRIVDVLLAAFGAAANSQGTMNNFLFGDDSFGFYETIGGGSGGSMYGAGGSAVHCHMTNTRLTDAEVLETNYPVRLKRFEIRQDSGGLGENPGGDGMVRAFEFLSAMDVSLLTSRRVKHPQGVNGGQHGAVGENRLIRASGSEEILLGSQQVQVSPGDVIEIRTPGGGGFGVASE